MTHNTRTPQTVPVFAGYLVLGMGYGLVEREQKETFTEKTCPLKKGHFFFQGAGQNPAPLFHLAIF